MPDLDIAHRQEQEQQARAALHELRTATRPPAPDLDENPERRAAQIAEIDAAYDPTGDAEVRAKIEVGRRADADGALGPRLAAEFRQLLDALETAAPSEIAALERRAAALVEWAEKRLASALASTTVVRRTQRYLGTRGIRNEVVFADGRREVAVIGPDELHEIEERRRRETQEREFGPLGTDGTVTLRPDDVRSWPGDRWLRLPVDVREQLLRGRTVTFRPPASTTGGP